MPPRPQYELQKVTLNLYRRDVDALESLYGHGWSTVIRNMVAKHITERRTAKITLPKTIGDVLNETPNVRST